MFLNKKNLTTEIAVHECCHAAFAFEQFISRFAMDYSDDKYLAHEERFCYYLGWLSDEVLKLLKKERFLR
jgi:hypothetical protein